MQEYAYDDRDASPVIVADREKSPFIYEDFELFDEKKGSSVTNKSQLQQRIESEEDNSGIGKVVDIMVWRD
jgi:hypothetical protein